MCATAFFPHFIKPQQKVHYQLRVRKKNILPKLREVFNLMWILRKFHEIIDWLVFNLPFSFSILFEESSSDKEKSVKIYTARVLPSGVKMIMKRKN